MEWWNGDKGVRLVVPAHDTKKSYVYFEFGEQFGTDPATPASIAFRLHLVS